MTNPVLVGVDGSEASFAAADWAAREAGLRKLPVRLLNIWQMPVSNVQFSPDPEGLRFWAEGRAVEIGKQIRDDHAGLIVSAEQEFGTPASALLEASAAAEMVVLGSHGPGGVAGYFYGSVSLHVLAHCDRPVVVVREPPGPDEPTGVGGRRQVVLGLDLGRPCDGLLDFAFEEAALRDVPLRAVHVWNQHATQGYGAPAMDLGLVEELRAARGHKLSAFLAPWREKFAAVEVVEELAGGRVAEEVLRAGRGADLLVIGRRRRRLPIAPRLGPVAHGVLHHAAGPAAVVPHG